MKNGYEKFFSEAQKEAQKKGQKGQPVKLSSNPSAEKKITLASAAETDKMTQILRERLKKNQTQKKPKKKSWKLAGFSFLGILIASFGLYQLENLEKFLKKVEFQFLGATWAEDAPEKQKEKSAEKPNEKAAEKASEKRGPEEKSAALSEEEINHFKKFRDREKELNSREEELQAADKEIQAQKVALEKRMAELESKRKEISSLLNERVKVDEEKVEQLTQMYSSMKPQQAAKVFESMDEDLAVNILGRMKKKSAAEIMNLMKAEKAKVFSERYAGYKRDISSTNNNSTKEGGKSD